MVTVSRSQAQQDPLKKRTLSRCAASFSFDLVTPSSQVPVLSKLISLPRKTKGRAPPPTPSPPRSPAAAGS